MSFLNELELICLHARIVCVSIQLNRLNDCYLTLNSIQYQSFVYTQLSGYKYCY